MTPEPRELLEKLAVLAPEEPKGHARQTFNGKGAFDLPRWIADHGLDVRGPYPWQGGQKWIFQTCPWNPAHTNRSAVIVQHASGAIAAKCHHNGCQGKDWHALRDLFEPGRREYRTAGGFAADWPDISEEEENVRILAQEREPEAAPQSKGLALTRLGDLLSEPEESVSWLVDKLLPASGFSLLVAKPKAGKSTLARNLALAIAQGRDFFGKSTQQGLVIYLALEEKRSEVKKHFRDMGATGEEEIYIFAASAPVDALQQIRAEVEKRKPVLLIIDPLFKLARVKDGNDYAQVTAALEPLLVLARETGAHVLCVHHAGKTDRDGGDAILGSTAIFAAADTALMMRRSERYRTLSSQQRYGEDLAESVLRFDPLTRTITLGGTREQAEGDRIAEAILACLKVQEDDQENGHALPQTELDAEVEGKTVYKRKALKTLVDGKQVERLGRGGKGDRYLYALKDSRFLVPVFPTIYQEQGNKQPKNDEPPQKDLPFACSQEFAPFACSQDSTEGTEQATEQDIDPPLSFSEQRAQDLEPEDAEVIE